MRSVVALACVALWLAGCATAPDVYRPAQGNNEVLRGPIASANGSTAVVADVVLGAGGEVPRHSHPGEEFLYVIEGSLTLMRDGEVARMMMAGDALRIAPGTVHSAIAGPDGARAVVTRIAIDGQPERIPAR